MSLEQPELFSSGAGAPVDLAEAALRHEALAARLPTGVRLGTSSWSFPGWRGEVWDRDASPSVLASHGLAAYVRHPLFRAVGLDRTYYEPLREAAYRAMARQVPADFRFVVKMDRRLVTPPDARAPGADADLFLNPVWAADEVIGPTAAGLGERLGALLLQFPPVDPGRVGGPRGFAERLYRFLRELSPFPALAVEIRTPELLTDDYVAALRHAGAVHGFVQHPRMATVERQAATASDLPGPRVVRWMLAPGETYEGARDSWQPFDRLRRPDPDTRAAIAEVVRNALAAGHEAFVVINNKAEGSSPASVIELARLLAG